MTNIKHKEIRKTLQHLNSLRTQEELETEITPQMYKDMEKKYQIANKFISQYMTRRDYDAQLMARMNLVEEGKQAPKYAHEFLDEVLDYKLRQAQKKGKQLKNDPRKKAFVDISDCLTIQSELDDNTSKEALCKKYGKYGYHNGKDEIIVQFNYNGNICIPFDNCYVYTCLDEIGCIVDIQVNDATYHGTAYYLFQDCVCIQSKFAIVRDNDTWKITLMLSNQQRPLGYPMCNIGALILLLVFEDFEGQLEYFGLTMEDDLKNFVAQFYAAMSRFLIDTLNYLSTYKSKYVYKLTCNDNVMYCYTTKIGDEVQEYMKDHYPQYTYEKLDGWIVNGYWKILDKNNSGIDRQGKAKKGFDWVTPYKNENRTQINSGQQQSSLIPIHALQRVKERYNMNLDTKDLQEITQMCRDGNVTKLTVRDKFGRLPKKDYKSNYTCYRLNYKNKYMDVVFEKQRESSRIMTFLPEPKEPQYPIIDSAVYNSIMQDVNK